MTKNEAITLQEMMMQEAVALLRVTERQGDTIKFERAIPLIGSVWNIPAENALKCLDAIAKEKTGIQVFEEEYLPMNAAIAESVGNLLALIETAMEAKTLQDCQTILGLAQELAIVQNLMDEIEQHTTVQ